MKKMLVIALMLFAVAFTSGCNRIEAGHVGIKVNLYGSDKGVADVAEVTGMVFYNPMSTSIYEWPTYMQNAVWTADSREGSKNDESIDFQTNDGMRISANVGLNYAYSAEHVPAMFKKFRKSPTIIQDTYLRTQIRDIFNTVASGYNIEKFIVEKDAFLTEVGNRAKAKLGPEGFIIDTLSFIGSPEYPASVVNSIQNKINASQIAEQKQRELEQERADADKVVAKARGEAESKLMIATAEAESIRKVNAALTATYVEYIKANSWDGKLPTVTGGSGTSFLIDTRNK
jgi:regulator of protease activity HflC (stomatin/prohibitin superfamily)